MLKLKDRSSGAELTLDAQEQFEALAVVCGAAFATPDITVEISFDSKELNGWLDHADDLRLKAAKLKAKAKINNSLN